MASVNNIAHFRAAKGWARPKLAKMMGTTPQQVERLEKGQRRVTVEWLDKAADALGVTAAHLITPISDSEDPAISPARPPLPANDDEIAEVQSLDLAFSMGPGSTIDDYIESTPIRFDLNYIRAFTRTATDRLRIARGVGESMFPTLVSSDLVWIDTTQTMLNQQDRIWAISLFGAAAIKRLRTIGKGRVLVISDNPTVENQEVDAKDLIIGGRVIRLGRDL